MIKYKKLIRTILAIYQILASLVGFYALVLSILSSDLMTNIMSFIFIFPILLFSFISSVAFLIYINNYKKVLIYTYINQAIQVVQFKFLGYGAYIILGTYAHFGYLNNGVAEFYYDYKLFTASVNVNLFSNLGGEMLLINLVPVLIICLIRYISSNDIN